MRSTDGCHPTPCAIPLGTLGSAAGIAVTGSVFYNRLASSRGDEASAFRHAIVSIAAFVAAALALVLADTFTRDP